MRLIQSCLSYLSSDGPIQLGLGAMLLANELRIHTRAEWGACEIHQSSLTRTEHELVYRSLRVRHRAEADWAGKVPDDTSPRQTK